MATEEPDTLSEERRDELLDTIAQRIRGMGLATSAILMLEAHKPLSFLGSQVILILQPLLGFAFDDQTTRAAVALLEDRANVERLISRLERTADDHA